MGLQSFEAWHEDPLGTYKYPECLCLRDTNLDLGQGYRLTSQKDAKKR